MDHAHVDHRFTRLDGSFIIFAVAPIPSEPPERAFDNPTLGQQHKTNGMHWAQDRLENPAKGLSHPFRQTALAVRRVGPNNLQAFELATQTFNQTSGAVVVLNRSRMDRHGQDQTKRVHGNMTFAPRYFLAAVVAALAAHLGRFYRLAVDDRSAGRFFAPFGDTDLRT